MEKPNMIAKKAQHLFQENAPEFKNLVKKHLPVLLGFVVTSLLLLQYFSLSVAIFLFGEHLLLTWKYPLGLVVCHLIIKFIISSFLRFLLECCNGQRRIRLSCKNMILSVAAPGVAAGLDLGLSNQALQLLAMPLYMMTKSMTVIFVLHFALSLQLEKKSWSLKGIVLLISVGLAMFTFDKSSNLNIFGMFSGLFASFLYGYRWTTSQHIMQKSVLGLEKPIDVMCHMIPWTLWATIPVALWFEGTQIYDSMLSTNWTETYAISKTVITILVGGAIAFCLELTQFMIISRASSLTLCVSEIFKVYALILLFESRKNLLSDFNFIGLLTCFSGTILYIIYKLWTSTYEEDDNIEGKNKSDGERDSMIISDKSKISTIGDIFENEKLKY